VLIQYLNINKQVKEVEKLENSDIEKQGMMVTLAKI
jgi:hypothetical protein